MIKKEEPKSSDPLSSFMKKQVRSHKDEGLGPVMMKKSDQEAEEKQLKQAQEESSAKASQHSQILMYKKLFMQAITKYFVAISLLCALAFLLIEALPIVISVVYGFIRGLFVI